MEVRDFRIILLTCAVEAIGERTAENTPKEFTEAISRENAGKITTIK